jgi:serine/threonine-protein kinase
MGEVYLARDTRLDRDVAIKLLSGPLCDDPTARERLLREARAASKLSHPNIVTIYAIDTFGTHDGIVMEYIDGVSLDQYRGVPGRTLADLVNVVWQVAEGLAGAHAAGIIHRDLKPGNILVDRHGRARILDFGLALTNQSARLTREGAMVGSPAYMSPEQIRGQAVDHRSDIFAFGILFYESLAGRHPFWAEQETAIMYAIVHDDPPPLSSRVTGLSAAWDRFAATCLAKELGARFATSTAMAAALRELISASGLSGSVGASGSNLILPGSPTPGSLAAPSVAVLPFADLSPEHDQEYFCDGLAEELINALSGISGLRVVARTSAFSFKGQSLDIPTIGRRLGVTSVLEGSVRKHGGRLRISAQLVNVNDGYQLWSERFDRDAGDIFAIQDEIAQTVAGRLRVRLGSLPSPPTRDVEAYNLYLQGRFFWNKRTTEAMHRALESFQAAIARDPEFALAYTGVADSYLILEDHGFIGYRDAIAKAREAVERALAIDETLAEAHSSLAGIHSELREFDAADREFRRAIQLKPGYATAHHWYATQMLLEVGRVDDAGREMHIAHELDPLSLIINTDLARHYYYTRDFAKAQTIVANALTLDPHFIKARRLMFLTLWQLQRYAEAVAEIPRWLPAYAGLDEDRTPWGEVLAKGGPTGILRRLLDIMLATNRGYPLHYAKATLFAQLGDPEAAVAALAENVNVRSPNFAGLRMDAFLDPIRSHPRFAELLQSLGI